MNEKILVTYATRTGSTQGVAEAIAETLAKGGSAVEVKPMDRVNDLNSYSAVVAGSAIQASAWLPEAVQFVRAHQNELSHKRFATFHVCLTLALKDGENYRAHAKEFAQPVRQLVKPISEAQFAGVLDLKKIPSPADRLKFAISILLGVWKAGDHRDWEKIKTWATSLRPMLSGS